MSKWHILGIVPTKNKDEIKEAYMNKLSLIHPEEDPEGFKELRSAYEQLIEEVEKEEEIIEEDNSPLGLWVKNIKEIYSTFSLRVNEDAWAELLNEDICYSLDTQEDASEKLLEFLMDNYNFPQKIWIILNNHFNWIDRKEELYEKFPYQFIDYVANRITYPDNLNYELFEIDNNKDYEEWIKTYYKIKRELNNREMNEAKTDLEYIDSLDIYHPYLKVLHVRYFLMSDKYKEARNICEDLIEKYSGDLSVAYSMAEIEWCENNVDCAKEWYEKCLEISSDDYNALSGLADCYLELNELDEAKKLYINLTRRSSYDNYVRNKIMEVNNKIIEKYKEKNVYSLEEKFKFAWCCYENCRYSEAMEFIRDLDISEEYENEYCDLLGRSNAACGNYEDSLKYFNKWCSKLEKKLKNNESEEKDLNQLEYIYYQKGRQFMNLKKYEEAIKECDRTLEINKDSLGALDLKAFSLNKLHKYEESLEISEKSISLNNSYITAYVNKSESLFELGYHRDALDAAMEAINIYPYDSEPYVLEMKIYYEHSEYDKILEIYSEAEKNNIVDDSINLYKFKALNNMKKYKEAEELGLSILENIKENGDYSEVIDEVYYELSLLYCDIHDYNKALDYINLAFEITNQKIKFYYCRGYIYRALKEYDKAIEDYNYTIKNNPDDIFAYLREAEIYMENNNLDKSIELYNEVLKINPKHEYANNSIGEIYEDKNDDEKALEYFNKQLEINKQSYYLINRGLLHARNDREEEAKKDYEEALKIDPDTPHPYNNIGVIYKDKGEFETAIQYFKKAIEVMGENVYIQFYNNIGKSYKELHMYEEAIKYYDEGIQKLQNQCSLYYNKAKTLVAMRKYEEAIEVYIIGSEFDDADKEDFYDEIGDAYIELQKYEEAIEWYEKVIKINPNHTFEYRQLGNAYSKKGDNIKALEYFLKQIKVSDDDPFNYICLADSYKDNGKKIKAYFYYKKALKIYLDKKGDSAFDACRIGHCYKELNKHNEAMIYLNKAIEKPCSHCDYDGCYESYYILGEIYEDMKKYEQAYKCFKKAYDLKDNLEEHVEALERIKKILNM